MLQFRRRRLLLLTAVQSNTPLEIGDLKVVLELFVWMMIFVAHDVLAVMFVVENLRLAITEQANLI
jgi:hypothetical protein